MWFRIASHSGGFADPRAGLVGEHPFRRLTRKGNAWGRDSRAPPPGLPVPQPQGIAARTAENAELSFAHNLCRGLFATPSPQPVPRHGGRRGRQPTQPEGRAEGHPRPSQPLACLPRRPRRPRRSRRSASAVPWRVRDDSSNQRVLSPFSAPFSALPLFRPATRRRRPRNIGQRWVRRALTHPTKTARNNVPERSAGAARGG